MPDNNFVIPSFERTDNTRNTENDPPIEHVIDSRTQNLIEEAKKRNALLSQELTQEKSRPTQKNNYIKIQLQQIAVVLKDGGMDTASQEKAIERIKEIIS